MRRNDMINLSTAIEDTVSPSQGFSKKRFLLSGYMTFFILGWLLFPEGVAGLSLGFIFLDLGLRSPD